MCHGHGATLCTCAGACRCTGANPTSAIYTTAVRARLWVCMYVGMCVCIPGEGDRQGRKRERERGREHVACRRVHMYVCVLPGVAGRPSRRVRRLHACKCCVCAHGGGGGDTGCAWYDQHPTAAQNAAAASACPLPEGLTTLCSCQHARCVLETPPATPAPRRQAGGSTGLT